MDLFHDRAQAILELARIGHSENVTVLFQDNGPGTPEGLRLIMSDSGAVLPARDSAGTAAYQVTRRRGTVSVRGTQGSRECELFASVPVASTLPLLLNNQALYHLYPVPELPSPH